MNNIDNEESQLIEQPNEIEYTFFSCFCIKSVLKYYLLLIFSMLLSIILALYSNGIVFVILSAIIPGSLIIEFARNFYDNYVTRCQMTVTFIETILYLNILSIFTGLLAKLLIISNEKIYDIFITAFILAGFMEELTKILPLIRIINNKYITNPRALWVYGVCVGAGFACFENIFYVIQGGLATAIVRSVLSVPLHCCTGLLMGMKMSIYKFRDKLSTTGCSKFKYFKALLLPILIHSLFDFVLMIGEEIDSSVYIFLAIMILLVTYLYLRFLLIKLEKEFENTENIHVMIKENRIIPPCEWFIH
jgi:RsiW-degrading membrane proteinase PrsW (M82 family)